MADYKAMYCKLYNRITDLIAELQALQRQTEAMFEAPEEEEGGAEAANQAIDTGETRQSAG